MLQLSYAHPRMPSTSYFAHVLLFFRILLLIMINTAAWHAKRLNRTRAFIDDGLLRIDPERPDGRTNEQQARGHHERSDPGPSGHQNSENGGGKSSNESPAHVHHPGYGAGKFPSDVHGDSPRGADSHFQEKHGRGQAIKSCKRICRQRGKQSEGPATQHGYDGNGAAGKF